MANAVYRTSSFGDTHVGTRTNTTLTPGVTAAANEGVLAILYDDNTSIGVTAPSGWAEHASSPVVWLSATKCIRVYSKVAGGSEPSSYTWTHSSKQTYGGIYICQNVNTAGFIDFLASGTTTAGQDPSASGTTSENNVLLVSHFTYSVNYGVLTAPSGFSTFGDAVNTFEIGSLLQASAGGTGAITWDTTVNDNTITILIGVKSEAVAGAVVADQLINGGRVNRGLVNAGRVN